MRSAAGWRSSYASHEDAGDEDQDAGEDFQALFAALLGNSSSSTHGRLETRHVKPVLEFLGFDLTGPEIAQMLKLMDANGDGFVNLSDFVSSMAPLNATSASSFEEDALERPWAAMSSDEDLVTIHEYRRAAEQMGDVFHAATDAEMKMCLQVIAKLTHRSLDRDSPELLPNSSEHAEKHRSFVANMRASMVSMRPSRASTSQGDVDPSTLDVAPELAAMAQQGGKRKSSFLAIPGGTKTQPDPGNKTLSRSGSSSGSLFNALARVSPDSVAEAHKQRGSQSGGGDVLAQKPSENGENQTEGNTFVTKRVPLQRSEDAPGADDNKEANEKESRTSIVGGSSPSTARGRRRSRPNSAVQVVTKPQFELVLRGALDDKTIERWMRYRV